MKKLMLGVLALAVASATAFTSCKQQNAVTLEEDEDTLMCCCPHSFLLLQPYGDFSEAEAQRISMDIIDNMPILIDEMGLSISVLPPKAMPAMAYNETSGRYRADSLLAYVGRQNTEKDSRVVLMGLTHKDIATSIHGQKDYGIIGYSVCPGRSSIVSTYRIKRTDDRWKTVTHEFLHTQGVPHCPNDDPACIMYDAKGGSPKNELKKGLCRTCAENAHLPIYDEKQKYIK